MKYDLANYENKYNYCNCTLNKYMHKPLYLVNAITDIIIVNFTSTFVS